MIRAILACWVLAVVALTNVRPAESDAKPNVILIVSDDFGWTDLGSYGSDFYQSPHIDRLAMDGMRFMANYSACTVCSPTRAALMTGKYPARLHITDWIPGQMPANPKLIVPDFTKYLPHEEVTIAEKLKAAGYATASIGKWHLGGQAYYPETQGFDINIGGTDHPQPRPSYFAPYDIATMKQGPEGEYITDRLTDEAVKFITEHKDKPFFLYLPHFAVHTPIQAKKDLIAKHQRRLQKHGKTTHTNAAYAAMIESLDDSVGRIRATLTELGIADRTIVMFTSDNGGRVPTTSNAPLRVGKGSCYEGGVRVPLIVYWPGVTSPGSESDVPTISMDLFPTILEMVGQAGGRGLGAGGEDASALCDGVSLVPLLKNDGTIPARSLYWHYPHYQHYQQGGTTPYGAIRRGDYRLVEFYDGRGVELYNLKDDIGEQHNLAAEKPELVKELRGELHAWLKSVDAQMPTKNPAYDPTKPEHENWGPPAVKSAKPHATRAAKTRAS
jgi:arylsulfatase A-like enzyme